jgi:rhodanese-related sulfurtransferase
VEQLLEKIASGEKPIIVDLRPPDTRMQEPGIPGALALSIDEVLSRQQELPQDRDVILYCACPDDAASVHVAWKLRKKGLLRVWPLAGGLAAWRLAGMEATPYNHSLQTRRAHISASA